MSSAPRNLDEDISLQAESGLLHRAGEVPIPGYTLIEPIGKGGFGEVWKCEAPGGLFKAIKFVQGESHCLDTAGFAEDELRAVQRIKCVRHPFILSMERVECDDNGELIIVMELADKNLAEVLAAERAAGRVGIPRGILLGYLREAAEALDVIHMQYNLQHLDVKPQNLFLVSNHVKVGDFGMVQSLSPESEASPSDLRALASTPRYAAPEVFQGAIGSYADQYSLAIVYQELLTCTLPFDGKNYRQLFFQHTQIEPDLTAVPESDRPAIMRALAKNPTQRFPSCSDFIHALFFGQTEVVSKRTHFVSTSPSSRPTRIEPETAKEVHLTPTSPDVSVSRRRFDDEEPHYRFGTSLPLDVVRMRLDGFCRQWNAETIFSDTDHIVLQMTIPRSFWQRWSGWQPKLEVSLRVVSSEDGIHKGPGAMLGGAEVWLHIWPGDCLAAQGAELLGVVGPLLAESVRTHLQLNPYKRSQERLVWRHRLTLCYVKEDGSLGTPIECQSKDISLNGIGFYVQGEVPSGDVMLNLPATAMTTCAFVRASIVRATPCGDGWHEVGAVFDIPCEVDEKSSASKRPEETSHIEATLNADGPVVQPARLLSGSSLSQREIIAAVLLVLAGGIGLTAGLWFRPSAADRSSFVNGSKETIQDDTTGPTKRAVWVEIQGIPTTTTDLAHAVALAPDGGVITIHGILPSRAVRVV